VIDLVIIYSYRISRRYKKSVGTPSQAGLDQDLLAAPDKAFGDWKYAEKTSLVVLVLPSFPIKRSVLIN
jgi:hypothetical protein